MISPIPLFFGCGNDDTGHYVWRPDGRLPRTSAGAQCAAFLILRDGRLAPPSHEWSGNGQGKALVHRYPGFDVLAFWDNSVDTRPGSNAMFLLPEIEGSRTPERLIERAKRTFPHIWQRFKFEVVVIGEETHESDTFFPL